LAFWHHERQTETQEGSQVTSLLECEEKCKNDDETQQGVNTAGTIKMAGRESNSTLHSIAKASLALQIPGPAP
jgi:hypothetical protein